MSSQPARWSDFVNALRHEVVPALGCTEPISVALAAAIGAQYLGAAPDRIEAKVSANLMKNGMGVTVPGTGMVGLPIAAAVGALGGDPGAGLEVLRALTPESVAAGKKMLADGAVDVGIVAVPHPIYADVRLFKGARSARVCIADAHTNVVLVERDGETVLRADGRTGPHAPTYSLRGAGARAVFEFAMTVPFADIRFILDAARINTALSQEGMTGNYGLHIGATMARNVGRGLLSDDLQGRIVMRSTAASDARMGGASLPAMSNSGSGNQGIVATMPVVVVAEHVGADDERLARALVLSHLMAIYIHDQLPRLSALCAVTTAAMGAAAGMAWLLEGSYRTVGMAICSMVGDLAGMICDGASNSCAMKVSTSVGSAYKAVLMALDDARVAGSDGIVADSVDESIANLCALASGSMVHTDRQIVEIMLAKSC
ncbi:MAG: L-serine ammonia-lyase, iron-sulfur-dependent, subunit alpha [Burkholderiales bacterium]